MKTILIAPTELDESIEVMMEKNINSRLLNLKVSTREQKYMELGSTNLIFLSN